MTAFDCAWVLNNLWVEDSLKHTRLLLLDALLYDNKVHTYLKWLFTDRRGCIKRKRQGKCTSDYMINAFLGTVNLRHIKEGAGPPVLIAVNTNTYQYLTLDEAYRRLKTAYINRHEALLMLKSPVASPYTRYVVKFHGSFQYNKETPGSATSAVHSRVYIERLAAYANEVLAAVEKNSKHRVVTAELLFYEDVQRSLWFMGTRECTAVPCMPAKQLVCTGPMHHYQYQRTTESALMRSSSSLIRGKAQIRIKQCPGVFCKVVLKSKDVETHDEDTLEELLDKVKRICSEATPQELEEMKLGIRVDQLMQAKSKPQRRLVPFRYILVSHALWHKSPHVDIDLQDLQQPFSQALEDTELLTQSHNFPRLFYDETLVCHRCYEVYQALALSPLADTTTSISSKGLTRGPSLRSQSDTTNIDELLGKLNEGLFQLKHGKQQPERPKPVLRKEKSLVQPQLHDTLNFQRMTTKLFPELRKAAVNQPAKRIFQSYLKKSKKVD